MDKKDTKISVYRILCFVLSIGSLLLSCLRWYLGLASAIASIVFAVLHGRSSEENDRLVICGAVISAVYIVIYILVFIIGASYFAGLGIDPLKPPK